MHHDLLYKICCIMVVEIPYRLAAAFTPRPGETVARISATILAVSLCALFGLVSAWRTPSALACALFKRGVLHSKFLSRLFCLLPSLWLTQGRRSAAGKKAIATSLCTRRSVVDRYPLAVTFSRIDRGLPLVKLRTFPKLLTSCFGQLTQGFQISIFTLRSEEGIGQLTIPYLGGYSYRY